MWETTVEFRFTHMHLELPEQIWMTLRFGSGCSLQNAQESRRTQSYTPDGMLSPKIGDWKVSEFALSNKSETEISVLRLTTLDHPMEEKARMGQSNRLGQSQEPGNLFAQHLIGEYQRLIRILLFELRPVERLPHVGKVTHGPTFLEWFSNLKKHFKKWTPQKHFSARIWNLKYRNETN